jgi:hypothetical protein
MAQASFGGSNLLAPAFFFQKFDRLPTGNGGF